MAVPRSVLSILVVVVAITAGALAGRWLGRMDRVEESGSVRDVHGSASPPAGPRRVAARRSLEALERALESVEEAAWEELIESFDRQVGFVDRRVVAARALTRVYDRDDSPAVRSAVLAALEHLGGAEAVPALASIARRDDDNATLAATRLSRIDDHTAANALVTVIEDEGRRGPLAANAVRALGRSSLRRVTPLMIALSARENEPNIRREAAQALGRIAEPGGIAALARLLGESDLRLRLAAIRSLGQIRSTRSRAFLESHLTKGDLDGREREMTEAGLATLRGRLVTPGAAR